MPNSALLRSLNFLGFSFSFQALGHVGFVLSPIKSFVGYRSSALALALLRSCGWVRFMGAFSCPSSVSGLRILGLPACGVVVIHA